jgi:hypothetical protein
MIRKYVLAFTIFASFAAIGADKSTKYYYGNIETSHLSSRHIFAKQEITLKKIVDSNKKLIIEIACAPIGPTPGAKYVISPVYMKVSSKGYLKISDKPNFVSNNITGTGSVFGTPWNWENLTFDMTTNFGGRTSWVKDVNFVSGEFLYGTKYIFINEGSEDAPKRKDEADLMMNLKMKEISQQTFIEKSFVLGCDF